MVSLTCGSYMIASFVGRVAVLAVVEDDQLIGPAFVLRQPFLPQVLHACPAFFHTVPRRVYEVIEGQVDQTRKPVSA
jgi:hypothetical protein